MLPLVDSIKRTNQEFEAIRNNAELGIIIVEDKNAYLRDLDSNDVILTITDEHTIHIISGNDRLRTTRNEILNCKDKYNNESLFAGFKAFVK